MEPTTNNHSGREADAARVITAFLWDGQRILLAQRSDRVSTFPRHWAGISGYVEGDDPLAWALVEVREECAIDREQLTVCRVGEPLLVEEAKNDRRFLVHPFLMFLNRPDLVRSDWEAAQMQWVPVDDLKSRRLTPTVPQLYEAFERVWPAWPVDEAAQTNLDLATGWLRHDRQMGAGQLARTAANELAKIVWLSRLDDVARTRRRLTDAADRLARVRPNMVPPANLLSDIVQAVQDQETAEGMMHEIERLVQQSRQAENEVARTASRQISPGTRILTISYSGTIRQTLLAATDRLAHVYVCEGRPLLEGRRLVTALGQAGIPTSLLTDAQAWSCLSRADCVLLGADAIYPDGSVVNKVGSTLLALAARDQKKRVWSAAQSLKIVRDASAEPQTFEENPAAEVWDDPPPGVEIVNQYFELVPARLIDDIITEYGPFPASLFEG